MTCLFNLKQLEQDFSQEEFDPEMPGKDLSVVTFWHLIGI